MDHKRVSHNSGDVVWRYFKAGNSNFMNGEKEG